MSRAREPRCGEFQPYHSQQNRIGNFPFMVFVLRFGFETPRQAP
jgi:hypothetical protein